MSCSIKVRRRVCASSSSIFSTSWRSWLRTALSRSCRRSAKIRSTRAWLGSSDALQRGIGDQGDRKLNVRPHATQHCDSNTGSHIWHTPLSGALILTNQTAFSTPDLIGSNCQLCLTTDACMACQTQRDGWSAHEKGAPPRSSPGCCQGRVRPRNYPRPPRSNISVSKNPPFE